MALTQKLTKPEQFYPPQGVDRSNTKARRAWLAAKVAELEAQGYVAKVTGQGSYQYVSARKVVQVATRLQLRGVCQVCCRTQAVQEGLVVLHGYERPGFGYTVGQCSGSRHEPANVSTALTEAIIAKLDQDIPRFQVEEKVAMARAGVIGSAPVGLWQTDRESALAWADYRHTYELRARQAKNNAWGATNYRQDLIAYAVAALDTPLTEVYIEVK